MNESYAECLVRRRIPFYSNILVIVMGVVTAVCVLLAFITNIIGLVLALVSGFCFYLLNRNSRVEFEYLYVEKILSIDKIFGKSKRKKAWEGKMEDIQVIAPAESHALNDYGASNAKVLDFSSRLPGAKVYAAVVRNGSGTLKILFEPDEKMLQCFRQTAPRKVLQ
ncbi:hypothetical protein D3Z51_04800 [Clostridiaceae bacterium]|nr:hypothetical protein [Clostridiaceae bacterium]RKI15805.1 hypothetical protein D7V81_05785 [bacterium 1XD21-70]